MLVYLFFFISGAAGLVYELLWVRQLTLVMGGTTHAIATVLASFMAGLAIGSAIGSRYARRLARPLRTYGILEIGIGISAALTPFLFHSTVPLYRALVAQTGLETTLPLQIARFLLSFLILLVPTALMGATLPVLVEFASRRIARYERVPGLLYGLNTIGAALGAAAAGFLLIPHLGRARSMLVVCAANLTLGFLSLALSRLWDRERAEAEPKESDGSPNSVSADGATSSLVMKRRSPFEPYLLVAFVSGLSAMAYQIAWNRLLVVQLGSSTYAFSMILIVFILGLGFGSYMIGLIGERIHRFAFWIAASQTALAITVLLSIPGFSHLPDLVVGWIEESGGAVPSLLKREFFYIARVLFLPTFFMGATLPLVMLAVTRSRGDASTTTGRVYSINTTGTILGSILCGFFLLTSPLGLYGTLVTGAAISGGLALLMFLLGSGHSRRSGLAGAVILIAGFAGAILYTRTAPLERATITAGAYLGEKSPAGTILFYKDGVDATVSVHETEDGNRFLRINGKSDASSLLGDMPTQVSLAQMPLILAKEQEDVLVIGLGAGITVASAALHENVKNLDVLEVSGGVVEAARDYFGRYNRDVLDDPRVRLYRNDGRNHLLLVDRSYDVIISEPSNPWMAGIANLFTREFFELAKSRLREDGVYCQWVHSYSMAPSDFLMIVRTLHEVFPNVTLWQPKYADFLLIAGDEGTDVSAIAARMFEPAIYGDLETIGLEHPSRFLASCLVQSDKLARWVGPGPINTDDNSLLEFSAPFHLHREDSRDIARSLARHQSSPVGSWITDGEENWTRALARLESRSRDGIFQGYALTNSGGMLRTEMLRALDELYATDPNDWRIYFFLNQTLNSLENELAAGRAIDERETRAFVQKMRGRLTAPETGPLSSFEEQVARAGDWLAELEDALSRGERIRAHELAARLRLLQRKAAVREVALEAEIARRLDEITAAMSPLDQSR
ncbi:MAG: fused MFS/spermidine synthase [Gemmatimonadetes bacterium]|nr:fused MFS/spermidine synthase [Gemmatimonadota bacterium]